MSEAPPNPNREPRSDFERLCSDLHVTPPERIALVYRLAEHRYWKTVKRLIPKEAFRA